MKITFMGAGSSVFVKKVLGDTLMCECFKDAEIALYDIDGERLEDSYMLITRLNKVINGNKAKIKKYLGVENRKKALKGANFVINAIQVGLYDPCTKIDFAIPKKYGINQTIGDTLGIGGIMRGMRTIHVLKDFAADILKNCNKFRGSLWTSSFSPHTGTFMGQHIVYNGTIPKCRRVTDELA